MPVSLKVYTNEDDALLYWSIAAPVPQCRGFAIERKLTDAHGVASDTFLPNRIGFENEVVPQPADGSAPTKPSTDWPFQRFSWTDHDADSGDTVSYRVIPVVRAGATLTQVAAEASDWSAPSHAGRGALRKLPAVLQPRVRDLAVHRAISQAAEQDAGAVQGDDHRQGRHDDPAIPLRRPPARAAEAAAAGKVRARRGVRRAVRARPTGSCSTR